jgi:cardiolipin synthase
MLRAETAVVDGTWAAVGTVNLDDRSLFMNYEINLVPQDPRLCRWLGAHFSLDLDEAKPMMGRQRVRRPWSRHVVEGIGRPVGRRP